MLSQKSTMKTKLENMYLQKRISYGYRKVINMMLLSGVISIIAIGILFANMMNYVNNVNAADQAVKTCRININTAARNIREMALNDDESTYDSYEEKVKELLGTVDTQMNVLHGTGVITEDLYTEYKGAFTDWGTIGYEIMEEIKAGKEDQAVDGILNKCTPALNSLVEISKKLDALTDKQRSKAVQSTIFCAVAGIAVIIIWNHYMRSRTWRRNLRKEICTASWNTTPRTRSEDLHTACVSPSISLERMSMILTAP